MCLVKAFHNIDFIQYSIQEYNSNNIKKNECFVRCSVHKQKYTNVTSVWEHIDKKNSHSIQFMCGGVIDFCHADCLCIIIVKVDKRNRSENK